MSIERVDYSTDDEYQQALQQEEYERQLNEEIELEMLQQKEYERELNEEIGLEMLQQKEYEKQLCEEQKDDLPF